MQAAPIALRAAQVPVVASQKAAPTQSLGQLARRADGGQRDARPVPSQRRPSSA